MPSTDTLVHSGGDKLLPSRSSPGGLHSIPRCARGTPEPGGDESRSFFAAHRAKARTWWRKHGARSTFRSCGRHDPSEGEHGHYPYPEDSTERGVMTTADANVSGRSERGATATVLHARNETRALEILTTEQPLLRAVTTSFGYIPAKASLADGMIAASRRCCAGGIGVRWSRRPHSYFLEKPAYRARRGMVIGSLAPNQCLAARGHRAGPVQSISRRAFQSVRLSAKNIEAFWERAASSRADRARDTESSLMQMPMGRYVPRHLRSYG